MRDYHDLTDEGRRRRLAGVARRALAAYPLDVVAMRGLTDATNGVFRLDTADGGRYAMRVGLGPPAGHTADEMRSEAAFLEALHGEPGIVVPGVVPSRSGDIVVEASAPNVPHVRACMVFTWLEGSLLADRLDEVTVDGLGEVMARLHRAALQFDPPTGFAAPRFDTVYPYELPFIVFSDAGDALLPPPRRAVYAEALGHVERALRDLAQGEPMRVLHGDLHMWNAKVHHRRISVFDFEDMVWGWPVQDIATTLYYFWSADDFDARWAEFRTGYERIAPWPDAGGEVATFIMARTLLMANDVISQPEWFAEAPAVYERGEHRIRDMLGRVGAPR
jgi:Ser/Thr protein kinase RdoA (MazF antagonist)